MMRGEASIRINHPANVIFPYLKEPDKIRQWLHNLLETEILTGDEIGVGARIRDVFCEAGGHIHEAEGEILAYEPDRQMTLRMRDTAFCATIEYRLRQQNDTTTITQIIHAEPNNRILKAIFMILSPLFLNRITARQLLLDLEKMKQVIEIAHTPIAHTLLGDLSG